jgi:hypothetical protein
MLMAHGGVVDEGLDIEELMVAHDGYWHEEERKERKIIGNYDVLTRFLDCNKGIFNNVG